MRLCVVKVAPLRKNTYDTAALTSEILEGEPVVVQSENGRSKRRIWVYVHAAHYSREGYVRLEHLGNEVVDEREFTVWPGSPHAGDPISAARAWLGVPYKMSGRTRQGVDCSGLVQLAYLEASNVLIERDTDLIAMAAGFERGSHFVPPNDRQPGDLILFRVAEDPVGRVNHVAMWTGDSIIHATWRPKGHPAGRACGVIEEQEGYLEQYVRHVVRILRPD